MENLIQKHIDKQDELEQRLSESIEKIIDKIDIQALMQDPQSTLQAVIDEVFKQVDDIAPEAMNNGFEFAEQIKKLQAKDKEIKVESGADPQVNKGEIDERTD